MKVASSSMETYTYFSHYLPLCTGPVQIKFMNNHALFESTNPTTPSIYLQFNCPCGMPRWCVRSLQHVDSLTIKA